MEASVTRDGFYGNETAHFLHNAVNDIQSKAGSLAHTFCREKRLEDVRLHFERDARAVVRDFHKHVFIFASGADGKLSIFFHSIDGIVDQVGPDLIELAAVGHHFRQVWGVLPLDGNAALQFVMHDGERRFQALLDVDFLQRRLVHVGIFFDGPDQIRYAGGALLEFDGDALHFQKGAEPGQLGAEGSSGGYRKTFEMRVGQVGIGKKRRELPGFSELMRFEPRLDRFFALDARKFVLVFSRLQIGTNLLLALGE